MHEVSNVDYSSIYKELKPTLTEKIEHTSENKEKCFSLINENKYICGDNDGIKKLEKERLQRSENIEESLNDKIINAEDSFKQKMVSEKILDKGISVFKWDNIIHSSSSLLNITNSVTQNFKNPFKKTTEDINSETLAVNNIEDQSLNTIKLSVTNNHNSNYKV